MLLRALRKHKFVKQPYGLFLKYQAYIVEIFRGGLERQTHNHNLTSVTATLG